MSKVKDIKIILKTGEKQKLPTRENLEGYHLIFQWKHCKPEGSVMIYAKCWKEKKPSNQEYSIHQDYHPDLEEK